MPMPVRLRSRRVKDFRSKCTSFLEQAAALLSGQDLSTDDDDEVRRLLADSQEQALPGAPH